MSADVLAVDIPADVADGLTPPTDDATTSETWTGEDGRTYRAVIGSYPDDFTTVNDFECYGRVEPLPRYWQGGSVRPDGFDGGAEIVSVGRSCDRYWWQPPSDAVRDPVLRRSLRGQLCDLLEFGFSIIYLDVQRECSDVPGEWHEVRSVSLGGVEPDSLGEFVGELVNMAGDTP
jgi:hypothetical protein